MFQKSGWEVSRSSSSSSDVNRGTSKIPPKFQNIAVDFFHSDADIFEHGQDSSRGDLGEGRELRVEKGVANQHQMNKTPAIITQPQLKTSPNSVYKVGDEERRGSDPVTACSEKIDV